MDQIIQTIAVYAIPVLFAITLHEAAHAYVAKYFGDSTAYMMGRMTLNPFKHIDPLGTIVIPIVMYIATQGSFLFGYAKPVPIHFGKLKNPKRDMAWVALAGPAANFIMAFLWTLVSIGLVLSNVEEQFFSQMARAGVLTNLVMFAFNLFPIPPLDGGRIAISVLPNRYAYYLARVEPYGFFIVMALVLLNVVYSWWMMPIMVGAQQMIKWLLWPLTLLF